MSRQIDIDHDADGHPIIHHSCVHVHYIQSVYYLQVLLFYEVFNFFIRVDVTEVHHTCWLVLMVVV